MDRLDKLINEYGQYRSKDCVEMFDLLIELKQRRESDLRPADKFLGNSISKQRIHILSEMAKALEQLELLYQFTSRAINYDKGIERAAEELVDLQMSCETMIAILGLDEQQRMKERRKVIAKNDVRGYYNES
jgi:hypothetical protein